MYDYFVDFETGRLESWEKVIPAFNYDKEVCSRLLHCTHVDQVHAHKNQTLYYFTLSLQVSYFDILVPTIDTVRYGFLLEKLLDVNHSVLYTGTTGVGKVSYCAASVLVLMS